MYEWEYYVSTKAPEFTGRHPWLCPSLSFLRKYHEQLPEAGILKSLADALARNIWWKYFCTHWHSRIKVTMKLARTNMISTHGDLYLDTFTPVRALHNFHTNMSMSIWIHSFKYFLLVPQNSTTIQHYSISFSRIITYQSACLKDHAQGGASHETNS